MYRQQDIRYALYTDMTGKLTWITFHSRRAALKAEGSVTEPGTSRKIGGWEGILTYRQMFKRGLLK